VENSHEVSDELTKIKVEIVRTKPKE
jgi:hypothetical protein